MVSALFLRLMGLFYLVAFISLGSQVQGLAGSQGIMPIADLLADFTARSGIERYFQVPTLFWLHTGDATLRDAEARRPFRSRALRLPSRSARLRPATCAVGRR